MEVEDGDEDVSSALSPDIPEEDLQKQSSSRGAAVFIKVVNVTCDEPWLTENQALILYTSVYLEAGPCMDKEQGDRSGLGQRPGLGQGPGLGLGLWLMLGLLPGARRSMFLLRAPFPPSIDGVLTITSLSTRPESYFCSY